MLKYFTCGNAHLICGIEDCCLENIWLKFNLKNHSFQKGMFTHEIVLSQPMSLILTNKNNIQM